MMLRWRFLYSEWMKSSMLGGSRSSTSAPHALRRWNAARMWASRVLIEGLMMAVGLPNSCPHHSAVLAQVARSAASAMSASAGSPCPPSLHGKRTLRVVSGSASSSSPFFFRGLGSGGARFAVTGSRGRVERQDWFLGRARHGFSLVRSFTSSRQNADIRAGARAHSVAI